MPPDRPLAVRPATQNDRATIIALSRTQRIVHQHLDWRPPEDWIGQSPFLLAEADGQAVGCLAFVPDPPDAAWLRLFAVSSGIEARAVWDALVPLTLDELRARRVQVIAGLALTAWLEGLLIRSAFVPGQSVVVLRRDRGQLPPTPRIEARIRPIGAGDLEAVTEVDWSAFRPPWQQSLASLRAALAHAAVATLAEQDGRIVGYQISTLTRSGGHLARLAVRPDVRRKGLGTALTLSAAEHLARKRRPVVTVNTQDDNLASLELYHRLGFERTGDVYPVYQYVADRDRP